MALNSPFLNVDYCFTSTLEMEMILSIWLKNVPPDAVLFTQLKIIESLILAISLPIATAAAPGKMKIYELTLGIIQLSIFFLSWVFLKMGYPAYSVFVIAIFINIVMFFVRLFIVSKLIELPINQFMYKVSFPVLGIILFSAVPSNILQRILPEGLIYSTIIVFFSLIISAIVMYYVGLDSIMRAKVRSFIKTKAQKIF